MKQFFDEKAYHENMKALNHVLSRGKRLKDVWHRAVKTPLTAEHVRKWIDDREYIWQVYRKENNIPDSVWPAMPVTEIPKLDDPYAAMVNLWPNVLERYKEPPGSRERGISVFVNNRWIEWKDGTPIIPEGMEAEIKTRCTFEPTDKAKPKIKAAVAYVDARNKAVEMFGKNIPVREKFNGTVEIDVTKLKKLNAETKTGNHGKL